VEFMARTDYITDEQVVKRAQVAVKLELEKNMALDAPIAVYDRERKVIIVKNSDGSEVEVENRLRRGRYSERRR
jgi:putative 50S ribosomal protein L24